MFILGADSIEGGFNPEVQHRSLHFRVESALPCIGFDRNPTLGDNVFRDWLQNPRIC